MNVRSAEAKSNLVLGQHGVRRDVRLPERQPDGEQDEVAISGEAAPGETAGVSGVQHSPAGPQPQDSRPGHQS